MIRYLRVSRLGDRRLGSDEFHSPRVQIEAINAELDRQFGPGRWRLADVKGNFTGDNVDDDVKGTWADLGVSGTSMARDGLDAAINAVAEHRAEALGVLNLSRWGRNVVGALHRIEELEGQGTALVSAQETVDFKTPEGWFATTLFLMVAELYARQKGQEWSRLIESYVRLGRHHGVPPLGYQRVKVPLDHERDIRMLVRDDDADSVEKAFQMVANGQSRTAVGVWLKDQGLLMRPTSAYKILTNRFYVRRHAASCVGTDCSVLEPHGAFGEVRSGQLEEGTKRRIGSAWHPGQHEGIIESDLFDRVQDRISEARVTGRRQRAEAIHELAGVLRCGTCGYVLGGHVRKGTSRVLFQDGNGRLRGCNGVGMVTASRILVVVRSELEELVNATDKEVERISFSLAATTGVGTTKRQVERRSRALDRIGELNASLALGDFTGSKEQAVRREVEKLEHIVDDIDETLARPATAPGPTKMDVVTKVRDLIERWDDLTVSARNAALREILTIYVRRRPEGTRWRLAYEDRLSIRWAWEAA